GIVYNDNAQGSIPTSIGNLRELSHLDFFLGSISGSLPTELFTLTKLNFLRFESNELSGTIPTAIGMLTNLVKLGLGFNQFRGSIPSEISKLTALEYMTFGPNQLGGSIPDEVTVLTNLTYLSIQENQITGSIATGISNLKKLQTLYLGQNQLNGSIPATLSLLTELESLFLDTNQLDGSIPATISMLTGLVYLYLDNNKFTGNINFNLALTNLRNLGLNNNRFSGSIPSEFDSLPELVVLDVSHNYLSGPVSEKLWPFHDMSGNYFTGRLDFSASIEKNLAGNCFARSKCPRTRPKCRLAQQRPAAECAAFCGGWNACDGRGICYPDGPSLVPTCLCSAGSVLVGRSYCFAQGWSQNISISEPILPVFTILTMGTQRQTAGRSMAKPVDLFVYPSSLRTGCGAELAFSVNFTFCLISQYGLGRSNGFAFVITANSKLGKAARAKLGRSDGEGYGGMDSRSVAIVFDTATDMKVQHVGLNINGLGTSLFAMGSPFTLTDGEYYTAWVDYDPWNRGSIKVFLADSRVKPEQPLLQRELSLCAVLQPSGQQPAFFFGFVASTTKKPFQMHAIRYSAVQTELRPPPEPVETTNQALGLVVSEGTYVPPGANPFSRYVSTDYQWTGNRVSVDSWAIRDFQNWDSMAFLDWPVKNQMDCSACWAYAVVASVEAAYGIANNEAAPQLSVESLFAAMGLNDADKCTAGGSPTAAFEKLVVTLDASSGLKADNDTAKTYPVQAFERALFKGQFGLMLAVRRQPVVVHIEAAAATFFKYNGTFKYADAACYTGSLNHVVLVVGYFINRDDGSQKRIAPPSWIIRNSWGVGWGDAGHMFMDIQGGDGVCGINVLPGIYPIVKIPDDPCRNNAYKGDQDPNGMNPCGRFPCQKISEGNRCNCVIGNVTQAMQPFVEVANGYGSKTCAYVDVCGSYFNNPCYVGSCINDRKGSYSCICPPNHIERDTFYGFPTCDPANFTATSMTVTGDNWQCANVSALVGIPWDKFRSTNAGIDCSQPLRKGSVLRLVGAPDIPCTAFFYALKSDTCSSMSSQLSLSKEDLAKLNPGFDCSLNGLKAGQSVCIERSSNFAYTVPECLRYGTVTAQTTCEGLLEKSTKEKGAKVTGSDWADLYRNNPGLTCSSAVPSNTQVQ
ncbi:unnamed protein product, partial [Closterium sp. Naga37s-1]